MNKIKIIQKLTMDNNHYLNPSWPAPHCIKAVSTLRTSGFSTAPFDQFNLGTHVNDDATAVAKNHQLLIKELGLLHPPGWLNQTHSNRCIYLSSTTSTYSVADASFTRESNIPCAVMTADCVPILLCQAEGLEVAAIHAGWRGLHSGIIENTLRQLQSTPAELMAWIGPAIGPDHFEIGDEVYHHFINKDQRLAPAFFQPQGNRWHGNLFLLCELILKQCGVTAIYCDYLCTFKDQQRFYSYRRDAGVTGRMASLIWIS